MLDPPGGKGHPAHLVVAEAVVRLGSVGMVVAVDGTFSAGVGVVVVVALVELAVAAAAP